MADRVVEQILDHTAQQVGVGPQRGDLDLLRRVIENLLDNAIRHAPRGSKVSLACCARDRAVEIRVTDAGSGVAEEMREKIFEPFVQVDNGERVVTRSGRGLGLAFCKLAIDAHAGRLWVEDASPGAVFCMRLPSE